MIDILELRDYLNWGFGNIARALFLSQMSDTPLAEILAMREDDMQGWGNILRSLIGHASLKGYNLGLIVSGRETPNGNPNHGYQVKADACGFKGEGGLAAYMDLIAEHGKATVNKACRLWADQPGEIMLQAIIDMLEDSMKLKEIRQSLQTSVDALDSPTTEEEGKGNGPPACKGYKKNDPGC
jgi:hypothetical protein